MKIAICKGGTNITFSSNNRTAANADILYTIKQLYDSTQENLDITIVTKITRNTVIPPMLKIVEYDDVNFDDYDYVVLFNFSINFFGGLDGGNLMGLYSKLSNSKTPIKFMFTDGQLPFKKLWPNIENREFAKKRKEQEFFINENRITYISQGLDREKTLRHISKIKHTYKPKNIIYMDIARFILANHFDRNKRSLIFPKCFNNEREYTLGFGGVERNSYKRKLIEKFYWPDYNLSVDTLIFGKLPTLYGDSIRNLGQVPFHNVLYRMSKCKYSVIVGDEFYENNFITLRYYECILSGCIPIMYSKMINDNIKYFREGKCLHVNDREDLKNILFSSNYNVFKTNMHDYICDTYDFNKERNNLMTILTM